MSQKEPVDVVFERVRTNRSSRSRLIADDIERMSNLVIGLLLLGVACYGVHLFLVNNFG